MNDEFIIRSKTKIKIAADGVIKRQFTGSLKRKYGTQDVESIEMLY